MARRSQPGELSSPDSSQLLQATVKLKARMLEADAGHTPPAALHIWPTWRRNMVISPRKRANLSNGILGNNLQEIRRFQFKQVTQRHRKEASNGAPSLRAGYTEGQSLDTSYSL